ncbi:alpha-N-acetylglucosaminidase-like isoform X2 [Pomacea canaliculata]|nr:alpha-N-acetylglucosaminidase-like isoform X2 [Pomacea canaliculata]
MSGAKLQVTGTSGVAAAMGFYYYLKQFCNSQFTWAGQNINLTSPLPRLSSPITIQAVDKFRYYQNVCTVSYSFAFWDWKRWEREIDWMALNGFNLPLAFTGQEAIFQRLYMNMGISFEDLEGFFGGPAFLAWSRMGNIQGWGGPLPQMWITNQLILQHQIVKRMRDFGMITVLPAFAGHVPAVFKTIFPKANISQFGSWGNFNKTYSFTYLLDFNDPLFQVVGSKLIELLQNEFGVDHIYNADTFNEMNPSSKNPAYLQAAGRSVFSAMEKADPDAVWLMQGGTFNFVEFWGPEEVKALVTAIPQGRLIILDLISELAPVYQRVESYYGQPFIWCMLHNFGGNMELYGDLNSINYGPFHGRSFPNSTMIGIGVTMEGINQNEVVYEFMNENAWRTSPRNITDWISNFVKQRYGRTTHGIDKAWQLLKTSVFNCSDGHIDVGHVIFTQRPSPNYNVLSDLWYDPELLFAAWDYFIQAIPDFLENDLFRYDLVDITRNSLQTVTLYYYSNAVWAFKTNDIFGIKDAGKLLSELLLDIDTLLASDKRFLLGTWLAQANAWGTDANEQALLRYNALNQITLWGPDGEIVDYASKQWAGVVKDYYKPRWDFFIDYIIQVVQNMTHFDDYIFNELLLEKVEKPFTFSTTNYPTTPTGNPFQLAQQFHLKYRESATPNLLQHLKMMSYDAKLTKLPKISRSYQHGYNKWRRWPSVK